MGIIPPLETGSHKSDPLLKTFEGKNDRLMKLSQPIQYPFFRSRSDIESQEQTV
jgi:hypothetical protein